ncbi:MAG: dihydrolipoyl dehydrogenase [Firmicutes bacterium]|nr:dihydrolipoyl dehydrogenase [Bacillota bacterium]
MNTYDLIVIGGGPAGYNAAERAAHGGLKTLLFEKRALGGVCLNEGCIPSKALLNSVKIYNYARHSAVYGVTTTGAKLDHKAVVARKDKVVSRLTGGVAAKLKKCGVTVITAEASLKQKTSTGFTITASSIDYTSKFLLVCVGSEAIVPPIPGAAEGVKSGFVMTNREILALQTLPKRLAVIGGGVIGLEMAEYFAGAGAEVRVIEMLDKIAGPTEKEISSILMSELEKAGIAFTLSAKVTAVGNGSVTFEKDGKSETWACDKVLMSVGRRPSAAGLNLEAAGVAMERGAVLTDECLRTNVPGLYAAGDVNGKSMLAHTAYREGEVAVNHMLGKRDVMRYNAIGSVIYTHPEVACAGETLESARAKGIDARCVTLPMMYSGRYMAENEGGSGICKVVTDAGSNRVIGVHMIGSYASEIIYGASLMIETEYNISDLRELVFPHPTCGEVIREALFEL